MAIEKKRDMSPKKILLAEDDIDDQAFFSEVLLSRKEVKLLPIVENGEDVLDFLNHASDAKELPDIIILDQNMPKMNGLQTLHRIQHSKTHKNIPVIIYTTNPDEKLIKRCIDSGAAQVFPKPYSPEDYGKLVDVLIELIKEKENGSRRK